MGALKRQKFRTLNQIDKEITDRIKIDLLYSVILDFLCCVNDSLILIVFEIINNLLYNEDVFKKYWFHPYPDEMEQLYAIIELYNGFNILESINLTICYLETQ